MIFDDNFLDLIKLFDKHEVKYVLVGGLAVLIHGHFRTTKDMDIFYERTEENVVKLLAAIDEFGFGYLKLSADDLLDDSGFIKIGREPVRIDIGRRRTLASNTY